MEKFEMRIIIKHKQSARIKRKLTIGSCFRVHYSVMEHVGGLESTKEA